MFFGDLLVRIYPDTEVKNQTKFHLKGFGWSVGS